MNDYLVSYKSIFKSVIWWSMIAMVPAIILLQVMYYQPFFGHMDDGTMLEVLAEGEDWLERARDFAFYHGKKFGYLGSTSFSMLIVLIIYAVVEFFGPLAFYAVNVVLVAAIVILFMTSLIRLNLFPPFMLPVAVAATFLWPFTVELVFYPGLQEKGILLAIALLFWWIHRAETVNSATIFWLGNLGLFALSALTKTQVVIFMPAVAVAAWVLRERFQHPWHPIVIALTAFVTAMFITLAGMMGSYSGNQRTGTLLQNAQLPYTLLMLGITLGFAVYLGVRWWRGDRRLIELVPLMMMATMWAAIVYFGYRNYFLSIFGPMFGAAVAVVVGNLRQMTLRRLATSAVLLATVGWILFRIPQVSLPQHGIGAFTQGELALSLAENHAVIYTSCWEGSGHFRRYTEQKWGISPDFRPLTGEGAYRFGIPEDAAYIFGDQRLCPAPPATSKWEVVWASPGKDGFRLFQRRDAGD